MRAAQGTSRLFEPVRLQRIGRAARVSILESWFFNSLALLPQAAAPPAVG